MINAATLIAWLRDRSNAKSPVVGAIYAGLAARIERGDFNQEETK